MVHIVFEKRPAEEVIYGIYIKVPDEVIQLVTNEPENYRMLPYRTKEEAEPPFNG